jgi:glucose-1-phosphate cytidylyltransferase
MKVILLAGGFGTRLSEYTDIVPKPMVNIGERPILWHIMNTFSAFNHKDFYLALGYKAEYIKSYFLDYTATNSDCTINLATGEITSLERKVPDWNITMIDTGLETMTGGRVKRLREFIGEETCLITYGDGLCDVDIDKLLAFHKSHGKLVTVTAVRPTARFGELELSNNCVKSFKEKPQLHEGWINGGYFVVEPKFFEYIDGDETMLEREPLEKVANSGQLMAYKHEGFWQCMDTKRDKELLERLWKNNPPWRR